MREIQTSRAAPDVSPDPGMQTFADLFCGIGGFHYAAHDLGLRCVFASDNDERCQDQYERNFGIRPLGDITRVKADTIPDHDILFGGFPCQPFSIIGDRRGMNDSRGTMFLEILRVLETKRPNGVVLENVRQFASFDGGDTLRQALSGLQFLGYTTDWKILNALDCGLPQKRERTIIVGLIGGLGSFVWPEPRKTYRPLIEILESDPDRRHVASETVRRKRLRSHTPAESPSIWHENKSGNISSHPYSCALRAGASHNYLLVDGKRRLTSRELLRLQGFPESFRVIGTDSQIRKQTGNAVPVPMVRAVIRNLLCATGENARSGECLQARPACA